MKIAVDLNVILDVAQNRQPHYSASEEVLRRARLASVLGVIISAQDVISILRRLGCQVSESELGWVVTPPSYRFDLRIEVDLIEELGRVYGYDRLPTDLEGAPLARGDLGYRAQPILARHGIHSAGINDLN